MRENSFRQELLQQAKALVFNNGSDAAALAFRGAGSGGDGEGAGLEGLDLSALSSIHRMANGSVELKFIDRIKLIELLLNAGDDARRGAEGDGFIQALDRAALRLGGARDAGADKARDAVAHGAGRGGAARGCGEDEYAAGEIDLERERGAAGAECGFDGEDADADGGADGERNGGG